MKKLSTECVDTLTKHIGDQSNDLVWRLDDLKNQITLLEPANSSFLMEEED